MPRTITAEGRTITVPDDATPDEVNEIFSQSASTPPALQSPSLRERFEGWANKTFAPVDNTGGVTQPYRSLSNVLASGARTIASMPGYVADVASAFATGGQDNNARLMQLLDPFENGKQMYDQYQETAKTDPNLAQQNLLGQLGGVYVAGKAVGAVARPVVRTVSDSIMRTPEMVRGTLKRASGVSPMDIRDIAKEEEAKVQQHADKTHVASNEQLAREDIERQALKSKADEIRAAQEAKKIKTLRDFYEESHPEPKTTLESGRERTAQELQSHKESLSRGIERMDTDVRSGLEAEEKYANLQADNMYSDLRKSLGDKTLPDRPFVDEEGNPIGTPKKYLEYIYENASKKITDWSNDPTLLKNLGERVKSGDAVGTWRDLQELRTKVGAELRKGNLPADQFTAYKGMMDDIDQGMQKVASAYGKGDEQTAARNYYRQYAETFYDKNSPVRKAIESSDPRERLRLLQSKMRVGGADVDAIQTLTRFDPNFPKKLNQMRMYQEEADAIPSTKTAPYKAPPSYTPPKCEGTPEELARQSVDQPERPEYTDRPELVNLQEREAQQIMENGRKATHSKAASIAGNLLTGVGSTWAMVEALRGQFSYAGAVIASRILIGGAQRGLGALLENEAVANWLARPTASDLKVIEKLTPEQRAVFSDKFQPVIKEADERGIQVSPALKALAGAGAASSQPRRLRDAFPAQPPTQ